MSRRLSPQRLDGRVRLCVFLMSCIVLLLHCTLASCGAVYCSQSCLWVCDSGQVDSVRTLLQPARMQCLSAFFILLCNCPWLYTICSVLLWHDIACLLKVSLNTSQPTNLVKPSCSKINLISKSID